MQKGCASHRCHGAKKQCAMYKYGVWMARHKQNFFFFLKKKRKDDFFLKNIYQKSQKSTKNLKKKKTRKINKNNQKTKNNFFKLTRIHMFSDLRGAQDRAQRCIKYAVGCGAPRSSPVCVSLGEANDAIEEEATCASLLGSPPFGNDTHGGSTTKMGVGEEAGESYGKTSFLPVLRRMLKSFRSTGRAVARRSPEALGDRLRGVHTKEDEAVNLSVPWRCPAGFLVLCIDLLWIAVCFLCEVTIPCELSSVTCDCCALALILPNLWLKKKSVIPISFCQNQKEKKKRPPKSTSPRRLKKMIC